MKKIIAIFTIALFIFSCEDTQLEYVFPKAYFPAYPESYWVYSDGSTVAVSPGYHEHSYYTTIENNERSEVVLVPKINEQFIYEYSITQNDNRIPLKQLLSESNGEVWTVGYWQNTEIRREVIAKDTTISLSTEIPETGEIQFDSCIIVKEYIYDTINPDAWLVKEIYAPYVGMIKREIQRDGDSLVEKELVDYFITQEF